MSVSALNAAKRRVRLATENCVDVFKCLPREDLSTLEITSAAFRETVSTQLGGVCLMALHTVRVNPEAGAIAVNGQVRFICRKRRLPQHWSWARRFDDNVYVVLERVARRSNTKSLELDGVVLDTVASEALVALQRHLIGTTSLNVTAINTDFALAQSAIFGFTNLKLSLRVHDSPIDHRLLSGDIVRNVRLSSSKFFIHATLTPRSDYSDEDILGLLSLRHHSAASIIASLDGLRLSSNFARRVIEAYLRGELADLADFQLRAAAIEPQDIDSLHFHDDFVYPDQARGKRYERKLPGLGQLVFEFDYPRHRCIHIFRNKNVVQ
ncbi:hypothetical protein AAVH_02271 [Aphelenchoides avenae]|nr:hypothetical protein AAVH_02271 [Aphelenchus avenae]